MGELMRFRSVRAPQRIIPPPHDVLLLERPPIVADSDRRRRSQPAPRSQFVANLIASQDRWELAANFSFDAVLNSSSETRQIVSALDQWLAARNNKPPLDRFPQEAQAAVQRATNPEWWQFRSSVADAIIASLFTDAQPEVRGLLMRWMLVMGLVELSIESPALVNTTEEIYSVLRWRSVIFPPELLGVVPRSVMARRPGFSDLFVTREEWNRYEPGEIAHIENVLAGESKSREHIRTTETEETTTTETVRAEITERDSQTTDRFELSQASSVDSSLAASIEGKVDTTGQYGPTRVDTHLGGSLDYSLDQSQSQATTQSRETISRAVTRVEERVREVRTVRSLLRISETNKHALNNEDNNPVVGVYRWVDKVQRCQVVRYPNRFLLEFQVPEPGAYYRWLHAEDNTQGLISEKPSPFENDGGEPLSAGDIIEDNFQVLAARWRAVGINPVPRNRVVAVTLRRDTPDDPTSDQAAIRFATETTLTVPTGYAASTWRANVLSWHSGVFQNAGCSINVTVGAGDIGAVASDVQYGSIAKSTNGAVGPIATGAIPVAIMSDAAFGWAINVEVECVPLPETLARWAIETYEQLLAAYISMRSRYEEELAARAVQVGIGIEGTSPQRNREIVQDELKRQVIELLTGQDFRGRPAITLDVNGQNPPETNLPEIRRLAPEIQFLEQAFEWENLTFVLYPYYWADTSRWPELAQIESTDPNFARFLRSGSARVVVPARPGFEPQVQLYVWTGILWGGGPVPAPGDEGYLSVAEEIKAQQRAGANGFPGEAWEVRLPTTLVWLENNVPLPRNSNPTIQIP